MSNPFSEIVVIDDNSIDQFILEKMLTSVFKTLQITSYFNSKDFLKAVSKMDNPNTICFIFLDLYLPEMPTRDFLTEMESLEIETPIFIVSSAPKSEQIIDSKLIAGYFCLSPLIDCSESAKQILNIKLGKYGKNKKIICA